MDRFLEPPAEAVYYLPVVLRGEVIGYLWASAADDAVGFYPRKAARHRDVVRAATIWVNRLREARNLAPSHVLYRWTGKPEHPQAGGVPGYVEQRHGDTAAMLREQATVTPPAERGPPPPGWMSWD